MLEFGMFGRSHVDTMNYLSFNRKFSFFLIIHVINYKDITSICPYKVFTSHYYYCFYGLFE